MGVADALIAGAVLAAAFALLYRSVRRTRGGCHGCDGSGCRPPEPGRLVRLGGDAGRRRAARDVRPSP